jgi:hypothetical protein
MSKRDELRRLAAEEAESAEEHRDEDYEIGPDTRVTRGHGRSKTLQVRLNEEEYAALEAIANARQLPVSTVARSVLLAMLSINTSDIVRQHTPDFERVSGQFMIFADIKTATPAVLIERMRTELDLLSEKIA